MSLIRFFQHVGDHASPDAVALERAGESQQTHSGYHRRIVQVSCAFGAVGAFLGILAAVVMAGDASSGQDARGLLLAPFLFCAGGLLYGVAMACLFAPRDFLAGPLGEKWMKLIGTKSIFGARIVCLFLGLITMAPFVGIGLVMVFAK